MIEPKTNHCTNLAFSPEVWERMFELVPSSALGLEMDPSHMVWLGIDYLQAIRDFGDRIYHAHAKDTEIQARCAAARGHLWAEFRRDHWLRVGLVARARARLGRSGLAGLPSAR